MPHVPPGLDAPLRRVAWSRATRIIATRHPPIDLFERVSPDPAGWEALIAAEQTSRRDKTGSRTFAGLPNRTRQKTNFQLSTFLTEWGNQAEAPAYGSLFQAAMGADPAVFSGGTVASVTDDTRVQFSAPHGLTSGQAVRVGDEIRFVAAIENSTTLFVNAPFSVTPQAGAEAGATITYKLATDLGSVSIFDFWDPATVVQRIVDGGVIDRLRVKVNGDFQEFLFAGPARDLLDSASFTSGQGGLTEFPVTAVEQA
jgi:hypothetical protein